MERVGRGGLKIGALDQRMGVVGGDEGKAIFGWRVK